MTRGVNSWPRNDILVDSETRRRDRGVCQRRDWVAEKRAALEASGARVLAVADGRTANVMTMMRAG